MMRRTTQQVLRNTIGTTASRSNHQPNLSTGISDHGDPQTVRHERAAFVEHDAALPRALTEPVPNINNNNAVFPQMPILPPLEPTPLTDVGAIRVRVGTALDALQTSDHMSPAELSLIQTVRETAADPEILNRIVNNGSFQEFVNMYVPAVLFQQRAQLAPEGNASSSSSHRPIISEYDGEEEYGVSYNRPSSASSNSSASGYSSSVTSSASEYEYDYYDDVETHFMQGRARRMHHLHELDPSNIQQRALNRLNELCHQISPDFTPGGWRTEGPPIVEQEPEPVAAFRPTMEGPGIPGEPTPVPTSTSTPTPAPLPAEPSKDPSPWTNPVYLFVVTACVIPITVLAVTAVVYPSPRTWDLLKTGVKAVCNKLRR